MAPIMIHGTKQYAPSPHIAGCSAMTKMLEKVPCHPLQRSTIVCQAPFRTWYTERVSIHAIWLGAETEIIRARVIISAEEQNRDQACQKQNG